ncbi:HIT domain-containing protein [candidate division WOR-3 bacterium]|nr:HIT domain-containing protein [candidate division WOR-3 bacterium]
MKRLWAPWRSKYISNVDNINECIFCRAAKEPDPKKTFRLLLTGKSLVILNLYPYNSGHILVSPIRHEGSFENLTTEELTDMNICIKEVLRALKNKFKPDGFNIGANLGRTAGAGIPGHFHMHIVPRWNGDTNFMPILGETKVVSMSPEETWHSLIDEIHV